MSWERLRLVAMGRRDIQLTPIPAERVLTRVLPPILIRRLNTLIGHLADEGTVVVHRGIRDLSRLRCVVFMAVAARSDRGSSIFGDAGAAEAPTTSRRPFLALAQRLSTTTTSTQMFFPSTTQSVAFAHSSVISCAGNGAVRANRLSLRLCTRWSL